MRQSNNSLTKIVDSCILSRPGKFSDILKEEKIKCTSEQFSHSLLQTFYMSKSGQRDVWE